MGMVMGYTLHLYCDHPEHPTYRTPEGMEYPFEIAGDSKSECYRKARTAGFYVNNAWARTGEGALGIGRVLCPFHYIKRRS